MRGVSLILAVLAAVTWAQPAAAQDRLVTACEVAVSAHARADGIVLSFPGHHRDDHTVVIEFAFDNAGRAFSGHATCTFAASEPPAPPQLTGLKVMDREGAGLFLIGQHAILEHFSPPAPGEARPQEPQEIEREPEPEKPGKRRMIG